MRTTFALFTKYGDAQKIIDELIDKNFAKSDINILAQKMAVEGNWDVNTRAMEEKESTKGSGQKVHGLDAMLGRRQPIRTTAVGDLYAAGEQANILAKTTAAPGAVDSGLQGALVDFGLNEATAQTLTEGVRSGELLIFVRTEDERSAEAVGLLNEGKGRHVATIRG